MKIKKKVGKTFFEVPQKSKIKELEIKNSEKQKPTGGVFVINGNRGESSGNSLKEDIMLAIRSLF